MSNTQLTTLTSKLAEKLDMAEEVEQQLHEHEMRDYENESD